MRTTRFFWLSALLLALLPGGTACVDDGGFGKPLILPSRAKLGETVAMSINSNYMPPGGEGKERFHLTQENVSLNLHVPAIANGVGALVATTTIRTIFESALAPGNQLVGNIFDSDGEQVGALLTIAVVDLPAELPPPYDNPTAAVPFDLELVLSIDGVPDGFVKNTLTLDGKEGTSLLFLDNSNVENFEGKPRLRLRGAWDSTAQVGFDPAWTDIASIEFTLEFPTAAVTNPDAFGMTEAYRSSVLVGPEVTPGAVKVVLVDPNGFELPSFEGLGVAGVVGNGPLLDVTFDVLSNGPGFAAGDFTVRGLKVKDRNGTLLTPPMGPTDDATVYFEQLALRSQPAPAP
ncbi:MAG: cohesin domain-containing protein [Proteobacteria bacterium]|nr:cohesin domain-containing protein [Pseudomonadota bacterium]